MSKNKKVEDKISKDYFEIDTGYVDLNLILLSLFISWGQLLYLFFAESIKIVIYKYYNWKIWAKYKNFLL